MTVNDRLTIPPASAVNPSLALHIAPVETVIHAQPLNSYTLFRINPYNGEKYPITLSRTKQAEFDALCARLNPTHAADFSINLQDLNGLAGGNEFQLYSNSQDVLNIREFVHAQWNNTFSWNVQLPGHRTSASNPQSFSHESPRLKNLRFGEAEAEKALQGKQFNEKLIQLKRSRAAQHLLEISGTILDQVSELVPNRQLQSANRKAQLLKQKELLDDRLKAILQFEAFHAVDATKQALKTKQSQAKAWIESHPDISRWERAKQLKLSTIDAEEEGLFAEDLARLGCKSKQEYGILGAKDRAEGPEVFYARLTEAVVAGNENEIRNVINGPESLFDVVFGQLNGEDQTRIKARLIAGAIELGTRLSRADAQRQSLQTIEDNRTLAGLFDGLIAASIDP